MSRFRSVPTMLNQVRSLNMTTTRTIVQDKNSRSAYAGLVKMYENSPRPANNPASKSKAVELMISSRKQMILQAHCSKKTDFAPAPLTSDKMSLMSNSVKMDKIFASFDLESVQVSFVGFMGDFAVWAVLDLSTGDIQFVVDDS
ncbi:Oidioi.mRNA.OKI2018_I69.chr2.g6763.t1.cds [Oikopleura dioica]|uniref:Oidioi.mRNA.OKI2018_I69.chr2.g6763.t1.cds n=1 Tax=Oikopleura dioica TaxID=34765 RepID=A0ABN7T426_OIKDI|nr:Oidioi.mRNA.OKI2018_I69.chr2.g6763.t1.cds [Oikopleura dioica]